MRAFPMMRELGYPVVFDVTHSLQLPGGGDGVTAGLAEYIEPLARPASAPAWTACFWRCTKTRQGEERRGERPALRVGAAARAADSHELVRRRMPSAESVHGQRANAASSMLRTTEATHLRAACAADGGAAIRGLVPQVDERFDRAVRLLATARPGDRDRDGQVGHHRAQIVGDVLKTGTSAFFLHPAEAIHGDLGVLPGRHRHRTVLQRRDRGRSAGRNHQRPGAR